MYNPDERRCAGRFLPGVLPLACALLVGCAAAGTGPSSVLVPPGTSCPPPPPLPGQAPTAPPLPGAPAVNPLHPSDGPGSGAGRFEGGALGAATGSLAAAALAGSGDPAEVAPECRGEQAGPTRPPPVQPPPLAYTDPPPPPPPPATAVEGGDEGEYTIRVHAVSRRAYAAAPIALNVPDRAITGPAPELAAVEAWTTRNQALTDQALQAILGQCVASFGRVTGDCRAIVDIGARSFGVVPAEARKEFVFLFDQSCPEGVAEPACVQGIIANNVFRSLRRGVLDPRPHVMNQGVRTQFTVVVRDSGKIQGRAGLETDAGFRTDAAGPASDREVRVLPYSQKMCFRLSAEDPQSALIEPVKRDDVTIGPDGVCMTMATGGGGLKYDPSWWVTPLTGVDLRLDLDTTYFVGTEERSFKYMPRPIIVDVIPTPGFWARANAFLKSATDTVNLATGLAKAIGALFAAIAAWGIWAWWKKSRSKRGK